VFLRPIVVRSKEQNESISMDRYEYMRAAGVTEQPVGDNILLRNLGAPQLPPLTNGQPPVNNGDMTRLPPPAPPTARPGAASGPGTNQPVSPAQPRVPEYRPVQPPQGQ
jgi:general secretion pathway protein D